MPGIPQVWYLDLFAGKNNYKAADNGGSAGHKEINRTTLTIQDIENGLKRDVVINQLEMIRLRNTLKAFLGEVKINETSNDEINILWVNNKDFAQLKVNLQKGDFSISFSNNEENKVITF